MMRTIQVFLLIALVFALVTLFGKSQLWAECEGQALIEAERIVESAAGVRMKIVYDKCSGVFIALYFWDDDEQDWVQTDLDAGWICIGAPDEFEGNCRLWVDVSPHTGCYLENLCWVNRRGQMTCR